VDTQQIIQDLARVDSARPLPQQSFNDDDWYIYETDSRLLVNIVSGKISSVVVDKMAGRGMDYARGLTAKYLGLWRYAA
jgi:hypothetical protein